MQYNLNTTTTTVITTKRREKNNQTKTKIEKKVHVPFGLRDFK